MERRGDLITGEDYEGINTGQDFTRPLASTELKYSYQQLTGDFEGSSLGFKLVTPYRFENGWIFSPQYEIPLVYSDLPSRDNPNGDYELGASDLRTQFIFIRPSTGRWSFASGALFIWPTASQDQMGLGKYIVGPTIGAAYHPESWDLGGYIGVLISDLVDYAGKDNRKDVHELLIRPVVNYNFEDFWFFSFAPEIRVNWEEDNDVFFPLKTSLGKLVGEDKVISCGFSVPVVNDYDLYDWQIELKFGYFF